MPQDRDTHFLGFAELLTTEIEALDDLTVPGTDLYLSYGHWKERVIQIIAQRAYDLLFHAVKHSLPYPQSDRVVEHIVLSHIPDLTQWPESLGSPPDAPTEQEPSNDQLL